MTAKGKLKKYGPQRKRKGKIPVGDYDIVFKCRGEAKYAKVRVLTGSAGNKMGTSNHFNPLDKYLPQHLPRTKRL